MNYTEILFLVSALLTPVGLIVVLRHEVRRLDEDKPHESRLDL